MRPETAVAGSRLAKEDNHGERATTSFKESTALKITTYLSVDQQPAGAVAGDVQAEVAAQDIVRQIGPPSVTRQLRRHKNSSCQEYISKGYYI